MPKMSPQDWRDILQLDARERRQGLPAGLLTSVLVAESAGDPDAVSSAGARGLFQFMPGTAKRFGIDPHDPFEAARGAEQYLGQLYKRYDGDVKKTLAGYNWGEGNVDKQGIANLPAATEGYLGKVLGYLSPKSAEAAPRPGAHKSGSFIDSDAFEHWLAAGRSRGATAPEMPPRDSTPPVVPPTDQESPAAPDTPGTPPRTPGVERIAVDIPYGDSPSGAATPIPHVPLTAQGQVSNEEALRQQDRQIARQYGYDPALIEQSSNYRPGMLLDIARRGIYAGSPGELGATAYEQPGTLGNLALRAGHGLASVATGANQLVQTGLSTIGLANAGDVALADLRAKQMDAQSQQVSAQSPAGLGFVAEMAGNMAAPLPIPAVGSRLATAALRGAGGAALTQPALNVSANPEERTASYLQEKGTQAAIGAGAGVILDTAGRGLASLGRTMVGQSRGQQAITKAAEANAKRTLGYETQVDDILNSNIAKMDDHLQSLETYGKRIARFGEDERLRGEVFDERLSDYQGRITAQREAARGAKEVPGRYKGPDVGEAYAAVRQQAGEAYVDLVPALDAANTVVEQVGAHANFAQGSPLLRIATRMRELGNTATVEDLIPLMRDAGKLTRAGDGQTRHMARSLFAGLHDAVDASAAQLPETDAARTALQAATRAARRDFAVGDLEEVVRMATGRNSTGQFQTLNIAQVLRNIERRFAGDSPRDKLFTNSFSPEERTQILGDFERFAGLRAIPAQPPTLRDLARTPLPISLEQPPVPPTLRTLPAVPELATPTLEPLKISTLVRNLAYGASAGTGLGALGGQYGTGAAVGAIVGVNVEIGAQMFAKALLNPRLRPLILRAVGPDGSIDPRIYGYLANQFTQERPTAPREQR